MAPNPSLDFKKLPGDMVLLILYHYLPNKEAAVAAVILYAVITIAVTAVTIKTQSWYMLTVGLTGLMELTGRQLLLQQSHGLTQMAICSWQSASLPSWLLYNSTGQVTAAQPGHPQHLQYSTQHVY